MYKSWWSLPGCMLAGLLAACASAPDTTQRIQQHQAAYAAAAGAPVRSFHLVSGTIDSWEPLSDTQLVVYTQPTRAFLLDTWPCRGLALTNSVGFTSFADEVSAGFDKILTGPGNLPCAIKQIRPLDRARLKLEKEVGRHATVVVRDHDSAVPAPAGSS